jgi:hypothetical protein
LIAVRARCGGQEVKMNNVLFQLRDVESEKLNAFCGEDESLLAACADALRWLWV